MNKIAKPNTYIYIYLISFFQGHCVPEQLFHRITPLTHIVLSRTRAARKPSSPPPVVLLSFELQVTACHAYNTLLIFFIFTLLLCILSNNLYTNKHMHTSMHTHAQSPTCQDFLSAVSNQSPTVSHYYLFFCSA